MSRNDVLSDLLSSIKNAERAGKDELSFKPVNKLAVEVLKIFKEHGYIRDFEIIKDGKGDIFKIKLAKRINDCGAIKPRFPVKKDEFIKWERRFLPGQGIGLLIVTTSQGVMTHEKAKRKGIGGKLVAYVY